MNIKTYTLVKTLKTIELIGEGNFVRFLNGLDEIHNNKDINDLIIKAFTSVFEVDYNEVRSNHKLKIYKDVLTYLFSKHTDLRQVEIGFILNHSNQQNVYLSIKKIKELSNNIPYEKELKDKINIVNNIIVNYKT